MHCLAFIGPLMGNRDHGIDIVRRRRHSFPVAAILPACVNSLLRRTWAPGIRIFDSDLVVSASRPPSAAEKRCSRHPRAPNEPACIHRCHVKPVTAQRPAAARLRPEHPQPPAPMELPRFHPGRTSWPATSRLATTSATAAPAAASRAADPGLRPATKTAGQPVTRTVPTAGAAAVSTTAAAAAS